MARRKRGEATQTSVIGAALAMHGYDPRAAYNEIKSRVGVEPLVYRNRKTGLLRIIGESLNPHVAKPYEIPYDDRTMHEMCLAQCYAIRSNKRGKKSGGSRGYNRQDSGIQETQDSLSQVQETHYDETEIESQIEETDESSEQIVITEPGTLKSDGEELLNWIQKIWRPMVENRNSNGDAMDSVGMRPALNGAKMLSQGITVDAIKDALTMDYPDEIRRLLHVVPVNTAMLNPEPRKGTGEKFDDKLPEHKQTNYCLALARARVPMYLYGGKGVGKSELARRIADILERPFGMVSMSPGTSPSAFFGRPKLSGDVVQSQFDKIVRDGGVYLFDEIDNGEAELLTLLNSVLANGHFTNDATGEIIPVHKDTVFIAAGNTIGNGSEGGYIRQPLDEATRDRWAAGRVKMALDESLESTLYWRILA